MRVQEKTKIHYTNQCKQKGSIYETLTFRISTRVLLYPISFLCVYTTTYRTQYIIKFPVYRIKMIAYHYACL